MIGGVGRHGRTRHDADNLARHLLRDSGATVAIAGSVAPDLRSLMSDMLLARDGSRASSAFLHMYLSPSRDMDDGELRRAALTVLRHFDALDHPAAIVTHEKEREGAGGSRHVHLVVGRVGPGADVLPSGFEIIRLETACRIVEYELGEPATLGRHHASALRWLRQQGRDDVADWLEAAHGPEPRKPQSAASPGKRATVERKAGPLAPLRADVRNAWKDSHDGKAFRGALASSGFSVVPGRKAGLWIVIQGSVEIGALDRIVRIRRDEVDRFMSGRVSPPAQPRNPPPRPSSRPVRLPRKGTREFHEVDLDELRRLAEAYGRRAGCADRDSLAADLRDELASRNDRALPLPLSRFRRRRGYDETPGPRLVSK